MASGNLEKIPYPAIFSIQHFCLQDGPGVRSMVFFKGCPLRCSWCQNPESWRKSPEIAFKAHLCVACHTCVSVCPKQAVKAPGVWDDSTCDRCLKCVDSCPSGAMTCFGTYYTIDELMDRLRPEFAFYDNTGGGVTVSGGEPALFPEFSAVLSRRLHEEGVRVAMETCGAYDLEAVVSLSADVDLILFDIKLYDSADHRKFCGKGNDQIKENLARVAALAIEGTGPAVWPRLPLIPTVTDTSENLVAWAGFLKSVGLSYLTLVPYHTLGAAKRQWLNLPSASEFPALTDERMEAARNILEDHAIACFAPGEEAWDRAEA